jgi:cytoskeleton protein RodZ
MMPSHVEGGDGGMGRGDAQGGPGPRLREARLAQKLSLEDVAARLRLDVRLMEAMERDDWERLPEPTFVRGYLRGYARLLGLPPGPIVEAYDRHGFRPPNLVADLAGPARGRARRRELPARALGGVLVAALLVAAVVWYLARDLAPPPPLPEPEREAPVPELAPREPLGGLQGDLPLAPPRPPAPATPEPEPAPSPEPAAPEPPAEVAPLEPPAAPMAPPEPAPATPPAPRTEAPPDRPAASAAPEPPASVPLTEPPGPAPGETPAGAPGEPPADAAAPAGDAGTGRLRLRFPEDSWVEIYDAEGERLFFNLVKGGRSIEVEGTPPLRVLLGYARGVEVEYNGEPFDIRPHTREDVARFRVGAE